MSAGDYALNGLLVAVVIRQIRGKRLTAFGLLWPIALIGIAAMKYLHSIPTAGNDGFLVVAGGLVGAALGTGAGALTEIRKLPTRGLVARATIPAAALWILGTGARMGFALFAENGGREAIARFSTANRITGASAWTACLLLMALAEVLGRTAALAWRCRPRDRVGSRTTTGVRMAAQGIDAGEFRDRQRQQWNAAADGWRKQHEYIDRVLAPVNERLIGMAGLAPGFRVLDVAAGYGEPTLPAARAVGAEGHVVATDISPEMLAFGRERASSQGFENVEFVESAAAALDFPSESFDAALSRFGIIFEPDGEAAAGQVRGFLKSGALMAIASWGTPDRVPFLSVPMLTALRLLEAEPPPPGTPGPLSRPTPEAIGGLLEGGGFSDVDVQEVWVRFEFPSEAEAAQFIRDIAAPITTMIRQHAPEREEEVWSAIAHALREHAEDGGGVTLDNLVLVAAGRA